MSPALFRRRHVWLPTLFGGLLLFGFAATAVAVFLTSAADFLAVREPAHGRDGRGAATLVVEGWLTRADLDQAIEAFRAGHYQRVVTSGGPTESWDDAPGWKTYAERAAIYLNAPGRIGIPVIAVPAPVSAQDRTFLSAVAVRDWARHAGVELDAFDLYTAGVHARRSRMVWRMAFGPAVEVGILAAVRRDHDATRWWRSSEGAKAVLGETISLIWTYCCFWPAPAPPAP